MYKLDRVVPQFYDFVHTDNMYSTCSYINQNINGTINSSMMNQLHELDDLISYILKYLKIFHEKENMFSASSCTNGNVNETMNSSMINQLHELDDSISYIFKYFKIFHEKENMFFESSCTNRNVNETMNSSMINQLHELDDSISYILKYFKIFYETKHKQLPKAKISTLEIEKTVSSISSTNLSTVAVQANPDNPPLGILLFYQLLIECGFNAVVKSFKHSTVQKLPNLVQKLVDNLCVTTIAKIYINCPKLHIVWNTVPVDCMFFTNLESPFLYGECILVQFILSGFNSGEMDELSIILLKIESGINFGNQSLKLSTLENLDQHSYFSQLKREIPSIIDCFLFTSLKRENLLHSLPPNLKSWLLFCSKFKCFSLV